MPAHLFGSGRLLVKSGITLTFENLNLKKLLLLFFDLVSGDPKFAQHLHQTLLFLLQILARGGQRENAQFGIL